MNEFVISKFCFNRVAKTRRTRDDEMRTVCPPLIESVNYCRQEAVGVRSVPLPQRSLSKSHENPSEYSLQLFILTIWGQLSQMTFEMGIYQLDPCIYWPFLINDLKWPLDDLWPHVRWGHIITCIPHYHQFVQMPENPWNIEQFCWAPPHTPCRFHSPFFPTTAVDNKCYIEPLDGWNSGWNYFVKNLLHQCRPIMSFWWYEVNFTSLYFW